MSIKTENNNQLPNFLPQSHFDENAMKQFKKLIKKKQQGQELTEEEIYFWIKGTVEKTIPYYQQSSLLMAIWFQKMTIIETVHLTNAMADNGKKIFYKDIEGFRIDKHSTGGIGDKTTLVLVPLLSSLGYKIPNISGTALGHTGGTIDKVQSIPGYKTNLSFDDMRACLRANGCFIARQNKDVAPADKTLYCIRDQTGSTDEISLITSSILSKKFAEGLESITLDVKCGSGALIKDYKGARQLAEYLVQTANTAGLMSEALITRMDYPLGEFAGNSAEVYEATLFMTPDSEYQDILQNRIQYCEKSQEHIQILNGVKSSKDNIIYITIALAINMLQSVGIEADKALEEIKEAFKCGQVIQQFKKLVMQQGGILGKLKYNFQTVVLDKLNNHQIYNENVYCFKAPYKSKIKSINSEKIGLLLNDLGSGRHSIKGSINYDVSLQFFAYQNQILEQGQEICKIYSPQQLQKQQLKDIEKMFVDSIEFTQDLKFQDTIPLVHDIVGYEL